MDGLPVMQCSLRGRNLQGAPLPLPAAAACLQPAATDQQVLPCSFFIKPLQSCCFLVRDVTILMMFHPRQNTHQCCLPAPCAPLLPCRREAAAA